MSSRVGTSAESRISKIQKINMRFKIMIAEIVDSDGSSTRIRILFKKEWFVRQNICLMIRIANLASGYTNAKDALSGLELHRFACVYFSN